MGYQEDYNKTLFLNAYGKAKPLKPNEAYQKYFTYECNITNPRAYHEQLISSGYLIPCTLRDMLGILKVVELKKICEELGVNKNGKKQEIIDRLIENVSPEILNNYTEQNKYYSLSQTGEEFLSSHQDYLDLHKNLNYEISLSEYESSKKLTSSSDFYQNALILLRRRLNSTAIPSLRNTYYSLAELYKHNEDTYSSLAALLHVLFFDINLTPDLSLFKNVKDVNEFYNFYGFAPGLIKEIVDLKSAYSPDMVNEIYSKYSNFARLCSQDTFEKLVQEIFATPQINNETYAIIFKENFINYLKANKLIVTKTQDITSATSDSENTSLGCGCLISIIFIFVILILIIMIF